MSEKHLRDDNQKKDNSNTSLIQSTEEIIMCPICLATVTNRGLISGCSHEFCFECIKKWSTEHNRCPICRSVYSNIRYNIVSNEVFDELAVEEQSESDGVEIILRLYIGTIRFIGHRNIMQVRRNQLLEVLNEIEEQMKRSNITRRQSRELKQRIQDILCERRRLDEAIHIANETLTRIASDEEMMQFFSGRDAELHEAIDLVFEHEDLFQDSDNPFELLQDQISEEESANHSDNESDSEEEVEEDNSRKRKYSQTEQNTDSDSDDSQEMPLKRPRRQ